MSDNLNDINNNDLKDQRSLLDYLNKDMTDRDQHDFENTISDDVFLTDAIEGLDKIRDKKNIAADVMHLNAELKKQVSKNKRRKDKRKLADQPWIYYTVILILILVVLAYIVIRKIN
ncbi:MAG: hypothetical protein WKF35_12970 [Ferruginibacter sp.]